MNEETIGALKRIIEEVKEKRKAKCIWIDCVINQEIGGNDIDLVENWMKKPKGWSECNHYATDEKGLCVRCGYNTLHLTNRELKKIK